MENVVSWILKSQNPVFPILQREDAAKKLLDLFYPVHYVVGMKVEDTLRTNDLLNRHQVAVLWIIRSEGTNGISMRRKNIENALTGWYETSSSAISKAVTSAGQATPEPSHYSRTPSVRPRKVGHSDSCRRKILATDDQ